MLFSLGMNLFLQEKNWLFFHKKKSSYIGFDSVSTLAGEVRDPGRNLPIGIVGTLVIVTTLYCAVSIVMTGVIRYDQVI